MLVPTGIIYYRRLLVRGNKGSVATYTPTATSFLPLPAQHPAPPPRVVYLCIIFVSMHTQGHDSLPLLTKLIPELVWYSCHGKVKVKRV